MKNLWITVSDIPDNVNIRELSACINNYLISKDNVYKLGVSLDEYDGNHYLYIEFIQDELDYILWQLKRIINEQEHKMICDICDKIKSKYVDNLQKFDKALSTYTVKPKPASLIIKDGDREKIIEP